MKKGHRIILERWRRNLQKVKADNWARVTHKIPPNEAREWLAQNCSGEYFTLQFIVYFKNHRDAVHFKLKFGGNLDLE